jgi:UDP-glucose-4-epimerase GalE
MHPAASMPPKIVVTGGAGYIGSHVCKAVRDTGCQPIAVDDLSHGHRWAVRWGPLEAGNILDTAWLADVLARHNPVAVIHMAGLIAAGESVTDPAKYYDGNVGGTLSLLNAMRMAKIDRLVFSSSAAVYGNPASVPIREDALLAPINPYGTTKLACERILQDYAQAYTIHSIALRYFNAVGADPDGEIGEAHPVETHLVPLVLMAAAGLRSHVELRGIDYATHDGTCIRDYVHVSDLAEAHVRALSYLAAHPGHHAFNLGRGVGVTVRDVIDMVRHVTRRPIPIAVESRRPGDPAILVADPALAQQHLGWSPRYSDLETCISSAWSWFLYGHPRVAFNQGSVLSRQG